MKKTTQKIVIAPSLQMNAVLTCQWFISGEYAPLPTGFAPLINGERTFNALASAIENAEHSINIITWGFQASMYLTRYSDAPAKRVGDLLIAAAERGVKVRLLVWFSTLGQIVDPNFPGYHPYEVECREAASLYGQCVPGQYNLHAEGQKTAVLTEDDYRYDKAWHYDIKNRRRGHGNIWVEHREMSWGLDRKAAKERLTHLEDNYPDTGFSQNTALTLFSTHHQKMAVFDYENPDLAVGFILGHNILSPYWDNDDHQGIQTQAQRGRDGQKPWQDISSCICGGTVAHLYHNFVQAWVKNVGLSHELSHSLALTATDHHFSFAKMEEFSQRLKLDSNFLFKPTMAQICRTQPQLNQVDLDSVQPLIQQEKVVSYDVEELYNNALVLARNYIYIENQYFRYPPFVESIKKALKRRQDAGSFQPLYIFVVTNTTAEPELQSGSYMTYRMLEALKRPDLVPNYHRKIHSELSDKESIVAGEIPGLNIHICTLVSPTPDPLKPTLWQPIYVHSKLMLVDDTFLTLGSSNINLRSMRFDSELNIVLQDSDPVGLIPPIRRHLWQQYTGSTLDEPEQVFEDWTKILLINKINKNKGLGPNYSLIEFLDENKKWRKGD